MAKLRDGEQIIKEGINGEIMYRITRIPNTKSENGGYFYEFKIFRNYEWRGDTIESVKWKKNHIPALRAILDEVEGYFNAAAEAYYRKRGSGPNMNHDLPKENKIVAPSQKNMDEAGSWPVVKQEDLSAGRPEQPLPTKTVSFDDDDIPF